jgi:O-antigen/teichoic acid export membrane protein
MDHPLRRQLALVSSLSLVSRVITAGISIVTVSLVVSALGASNFGVYSVVIALPAVGSFLDTGVGAGIRTAVAEAHGRGDVEAEKRAFISGVAMLCSASLVIAGVAVPAALAVDWAATTGSDAAHSSQLTVAVLVVVLLFVAGLPLLASSRALEGMGLSHFVAVSSILPSMTLLLGAVFLIRGHAATFLSMAVASGVSGLSAGTVLTIVVLRRYRTKGVRRAHASLAMVREMWRTSWPMLIIGLALSVAYSTDPIVVGSVLGAEAAGKFAIAARLSQFVTLVIYSTAPVLWSHFVKQRAVGQAPSLSEVTALAGRYAGVAAALGVPFALLGSWVSGGWTSGEIEAPTSLFAAFAVWSVVLAFHLPVAMSLNDPAGLRFQAKTTMVMAAVNLPLSIFLAGEFGPSGPVWSSAICLAIFHAAPLFLRLSRRPIQPASNHLGRFAA